MKALILDAFQKDNKELDMARQSLANNLKKNNWEIKTFTLRDTEIAPCLGCFGCWVKTPGMCVINDAARDIVKHASQSDLWVFLTQITFGGYSSELKKAIDRMICLGLPFFNKVKNEVHHKPRYSKRSILIGIGYLEKHDEESEKIFQRLIARNAINFQNSAYNSQILLSHDSDNEVVKKITDVIKAVNI